MDTIKPPPFPFPFLPFHATVTIANEWLTQIPPPTELEINGLKSVSTKGQVNVHSRLGCQVILSKKLDGMTVAMVEDRPYYTLWAWRLCIVACIVEETLEEKDGEDSSVGHILSWSDNICYGSRISFWRGKKPKLCCLPIAFPKN